VYRPWDGYLQANQRPLHTPPFRQRVDVVCRPAGCQSRRETANARTRSRRAQGRALGIHCLFEPSTVPRLLRAWCWWCLDCWSRYGWGILSISRMLFRETESVWGLARTSLSKIGERCS